MVNIKTIRIYLVPRWDNRWFRICTVEYNSSRAASSSFAILYDYALLLIPPPSPSSSSFLWPEHGSTNPASSSPPQPTSLLAAAATTPHWPRKPDGDMLEGIGEMPPNEVADERDAATYVTIEYQTPRIKAAVHQATSTCGGGASAGVCSPRVT